MPLAKAAKAAKAEKGWAGKNNSFPSRPSRPLREAFSGVRAGLDGSGQLGEIAGAKIVIIDR